MAKPIPTDIPDSVKARFWAKAGVHGPDDCWEWQGSKWRGYGRLSIAGHKNARAHRVSFILSGGEIPDGLVLDHLCRNPSCVNPRHLEAVTIAENVRRGLAGHNIIARGLATTRCKRGHDYTPENTYLNKNGDRACRTCGIERNRVRRAAERVAKGLPAGKLVFGLRRG